MPNQGITFDGAYISLPGAYYADNVANAGPNTPPFTPPLLFLGYGWGPKPFVPTSYVNTQNLLAALRGGPASAYVPFMANPSPAVNGAQLITFMDVSSNTQSNLSIAYGSGISHTTIGYWNLASTQYGPPSNQITATVTSGVVAASVEPIPNINITLTDNYAGSQISGLNLGAPFIVAYSGAATGAVYMSVYPTGSVQQFYLSSPVPTESVTFTIGSGGYSTVSQLVDAINGTGNFFAELVSSTNGQLPTTFLNAVTGSGTTAYVLVPSGGSLQWNAVGALLYEVPFWVNQFASSIASATTSGALSYNAVCTATGTTTFFSGATGVPPTNSSYASGLTAALSVPAWNVFCDSNTTAVQALMAQHCEIASSAPYGMWRRGFTGSNIGDSVTTSATNAQNLDSLQMAYLYPGIYRTNTTTGQNQLYSGLYVAAAAAAIAAGNTIALPLTNKVLNGNGVETPAGTSQLTASQLTTLEDAGVMAIWQTAQFNGPPTIMSDVTTWQADGNIENTSSQQVACRYWLAYSITNILRQYVGTIASPTTEVTILNAVKRILNALIYTGGSSNGVLASWVPGSLVLTYTGTLQLASITVDVTLVGQNRYITCFATVEPLNFVIVNTSAT